MNINEKILKSKPHILPNMENKKYRLHLNENLFDAHSTLEQPAQKQIIKCIKEYSIQGNLYNKLLDKISWYNSISTDCIMISHGSDDALKVISDTICNEQSVVLTLTPTYSHYIQVLHLRCKNVLGLAVDWEVDTEKTIHTKLKKELSTGKYTTFYMCNPNMPLGYCIDNLYLMNLVKNFPKVSFIIDEAYYEYGAFTSMASYVKQFQNLVVTRTFSKAFGIAGARLGYLVSNPVNIPYFQVVHNFKNVTNFAMSTGLGVLNNYNNFYLEKFKEMQTIRTWIAKELSKIVHPNRLIYKYNIQYGNYFIVICKDPEDLVKYFLDKHSICVRLKSTEIPGAVRISIGPRPIMQEVITILSDYNKPFNKKKSWLFDLDGCLRDGITGCNFYPKTKEILDKIGKDNYYIVTNNTVQVPEDIQAEFRQAGIECKLSNIRTPLISIVQYLQTKKYKNVYIMAYEHILKFFEGHGFAYDSKQKTDAVVLCNNIYQGIHSVHKICELLYNKAEFIVGETSPSCPAKDFQEIKGTSEIIMPDLGAFVKMLEYTGYKGAICLGKPNTYMIRDLLQERKDELIMIGDSLDTDYELAKKINCDFVHIGNTECVNYYSCINLESLLGLI